MDVLATAVLGLLTLGAGTAALFMSPFLMMATDSADQNAKVGFLGWAYAVTWGGTALGLIGTAVAVFRAAHRHATMWFWPALGIVVIGVCFAIGALLATKVANKPG